MDKQLIADRIREERKRCNLSQSDVAEHMGWGRSKHAIVVEVESGKREVKAWELYKLAQLFHIEVEDFFTATSTETPLVLWREKPKEARTLKERQFLQRCEDYKFLEDILGEKLPIKRVLPRHKIDIHSADRRGANEIADTVRKELNLGEFPAHTLLKVLEEHYSVKFLALPLGKDVKDGSAACTFFDFGAAILLNEHEVPSRQTFSIAHELFHIITWDVDLFNTVLPDPKLYKKNEQLADAFAAGLLIPAMSLRQQMTRLQENGSVSHSTLVAIAREYGVSIPALIYRLAYLGLIPQESVDQLLNDHSLVALNKRSSAHSKVPTIRVGERFVRIAFLAYQFGKISRSRLARLLNTSLVSLERFLESYGLVENENDEIRLSNS